MAKKLNIEKIQKSLVNDESNIIEDYTPEISNTPKTLAENAALNSSFNNFWSSYAIDPLGQVVSENDMDYVMLISTMRKALVSYFDYSIKNKEYSEKEKRDFQRRLEHILFQDGRAVIFKFKDKWYPAAYSTDDVELDFYGNPKSVKINLYLGIDKKKDEIIEIKDPENFVTIYNNSDKKGTLWYFWKRLKETVKRLWDLDHANAVSRPQILWKSKTDDASIRDIEIAIKNTDKSVVKIPSTFKENIEIWNPADVTESRQGQVMFYINFLFKFLGFNVNDNLNGVRKTELEIRKTESLTTLVKDMFLEREPVFKDLTKKGFKISIDYDEDLEKREDEKAKVNGEVNKELVGQDGGNKNA